jgi:Ku70/Ku80 beta-barrel domain
VSLFATNIKKQISPPGFHLVHLPFADDVREATAEELAPQPKANAEQVCVYIHAITSVTIDLLLLASS